MRRRGNEDVPVGGTKKKSDKDKTVKVETRSSWWTWAMWVLISLCTLLMALPYILRLFPGVLQHLIYSHEVTYLMDLSRPADLGLNHTISMYLSSEEGVTLGVWHTVPEQKWKEAQGKGQEWYEKSLGDGSPVFIYLHGNAGNRAFPPHRVGVPNLLSSLGYHALVMDYRGFGDSTGEPTELGVVTDALYLYHWVRARSKDSPVIIWGHSIGTGVATLTAVRLQEQGNSADAVIIEAAFLHAVIRGVDNHPLLWYYWRFPYIQYFFVGKNKLKESKWTFPNDENLKKIKTPLMILHAKDDGMIPFHVAEKLYSIAKSAQKSEDRVKLVLFDESLGYLHNGLYRDPQMPSLLREFVQSLKP